MLIQSTTSLILVFNNNYLIIVVGKLKNQNMMKALTTFILTVFIAMSSIAQEKNIITKSVSLDNLITFIVDNYATQNENLEFDFQNITFLIQVPETSLSIEDKVILKQAFKILSNRLTEDDLISIITYS